MIFVTSRGQYGHLEELSEDPLTCQKWHVSLPIDQGSRHRPKESRRRQMMISLVLHQSLLGEQAELVGLVVRRARSGCGDHIAKGIEVYLEGFDLGVHGSHLEARSEDRASP